MADDGRKKAARKRLFAMRARPRPRGGRGAHGLYYFLVASHFVSTDDAYIGADVAQVTPLVSGPVKAVHVADTEAVKAG